MDFSKQFYFLSALQDSLIQYQVIFQNIIYKAIKTLMQYPSKNNIQFNSNVEREIIFPVNYYPFRGLACKNNQFIKTDIKKKFTQDEINKITKLYHKNLIGLKKIGKSKKTGQEELFWLYYQAIPYSLQMILSQNQIDINPSILESSLTELKDYLDSLKIPLQLQQANIGVSQTGVVKVYISVQSILKVNDGAKKNQDSNAKIKEIKLWYASQYNRKSLKPIHLTPVLDKNANQKKLKKFVEIKYDFQKLRKKNRSQQSKNNSMIGSPNQQKKVKNINIQGQPHSIVINVYNEKTPKALQKTTDYKQSQSKQKINVEYLQNIQANLNLNASPNPHQHQHQHQHPHHQVPIPIPHLSPSPTPYYSKNIKPPIGRFQYEYDDQSVDTYQMEMGEDFQMPSMRTNQKLRQTVLNNKKQWDTLTHKSPQNLNINKNSKIHQSAGKKDFNYILQNNRKVLRQASLRQLQGAYDNKTVQDSHSKQKNWQSSTIKSAFPANIQDRVQQALVKTKSVVQMLKNNKNPKSFSAGK